MIVINSLRQRTKVVLPGLLVVLAAGCDDSRRGIVPSDEPAIGDVDPNAPPGWPLRIGDPDFVELFSPGGVRAGYDSWLGNCCISVVDGVRYTAKFSIGKRNGKNYNIYEGHVKAEPQWDVIASSFPDRFSPEEWEDIKTYPGWEELIKPDPRPDLDKRWPHGRPVDTMKFRIGGNTVKGYGAHQASTCISIGAA